MRTASELGLAETGLLSESIRHFQFQKLVIDRAMTRRPAQSPRQDLNNRPARARLMAIAANFTVPARLVLNATGTCERISIFRQGSAGAAESPCNRYFLHHKIQQFFFCRPHRNWALFFTYLHLHCSE
jgi:hypothetical protein